MASLAVTLCRQVRRQGLISRWETAPGLGAMLVSGSDATGFLQAQLTSDVASLHPGDGHLSARLDRTGKLQAWFSLHQLPARGQPFASYLLVLPRTEIPELAADLGHFIIAEQVWVEDVSADFHGLVVQGPASRELFAATCLPSPASEGAEHNLDILQSGPANQETWILRRSFTGDAGFLILCPASDKAAAILTDVQAQAADAGLVELSNADTDRRVWQWLCLEAGWPTLDLDLPAGDRVLPQTGLEQFAVSYTKGCYLGQEVVARIRTYGSVPQALRGLIFAYPNGVDLPVPGSTLETPAGEKLGTWASGGYSVVLDSPIALAFLNRDSRTPGHRITVQTDGGPAEAEVALLPFYTAVSSAEQAARLHDRAIGIFSQGQDGEALGLLEQALHLDPGRTDSYEALGVIIGRAGRFHEAIDIFRRLEEIAPREPMVHTNLSLFYMKIGDTEEAERQKALATLKKFGGNTAVQDAARLDAEERTNRHASARTKQAMFAEVLDLDPDDPLALMGMGRALTDLDDPEGAEPFLTRALSRQDDNSSLYASLGRILTDLGRLEDAADILQKGITVASRQGDLLTLRDMENRLRLLGPGFS